MQKCHKESKNSIFLISSCASLVTTIHCTYFIFDIENVQETKFCQKGMQLIRKNVLGHVFVVLVPVCSADIGRGTLSQFVRYASVDCSPAALVSCAL